MGKKDRSFFKKLEDLDEGLISNVDHVEEGDGKTWFGMDMTQEEKIEARRPWCKNLIIRVVGYPVGYYYLWRRIQALRRTQVEPLLIDLGNDFFIIKLTCVAECVRALCDGPWVGGDNYLHVQRWRPKFFAVVAKIYTLPVTT